MALNFNLDYFETNNINQTPGMFFCSFFFSFSSGYKKRRKSCDPADLDAQISSVSHKIGDLVDVIGQQKSKKEQPADWVSVALAEDLKRLPIDLSVKAQAEMFGVLAKYTKIAINGVSVQENIVKPFNFHDYC